MESALLCICPPYPYISPPAGAAALLGYLKASGINDFGFLDLRLATPPCYEPTYSATGVFGESYVMDVPDLPLVLELLKASDNSRQYVPEITPLIQKYCFERGISTGYLLSYLRGLDLYYEKAFERLKGVDFIGFSVWTSNFLTTLLAAHHLKRKRPQPFVVAGGPQLSESPASAALGLRSGLFDAVSVGEGEETLRSLYVAFRENGRRPVHGIAGTKFVDGSTGKIAAAPQPLLKLEQLPLPSFDEMAIDAYQSDEYRTLPFQLSRGCTDKCTFCSEWVFWQRYRLSPAEESVEKIRQLRSLYSANYIEFTDSLLNGSPKRLIAFAEALLQKHVGIEWGGFMRAEIDLPTARLLRRAGCREVFVGVESFDDETLALMNKRRTESDNLRALRAFLEAGLFVVAGMIPGFPGDSRKGFLHSAATMRDLQFEYPGQLRVNTEPFRVSPGQPLYDNLEGSGLIPHPWRDEYLAIAPRYQDITSQIHCFVEGANQGIERIGRERLAFMVTTDALVRTDKFIYDEDEDVSMDEFAFQHVYGGWHLGRIKSSAGYIYALIVSGAEMEELEELIAESRLEGLRNSPLSARLKTLEGSHISFPSAEMPPIPHPRCCVNVSDDDMLSVSPFVVIRQLDWRWSQQLLVVNYVNGRVIRRPKSELGILRKVAERPSTVARLIDVKSQNGSKVRRQALRTTIDDLLENGVIMICQSARAIPKGDVTGVVLRKTDTVLSALQDSGHNAASSPETL